MQGRGASLLGHRFCVLWEGPERSIAERSPSEGYFLRKLRCYVRRDGVHMGAEHYRGSTRPSEQQVQSAVSHFHQLL